MHMQVSLNNKLLNDIGGIHVVAEVLRELYPEGNRIASLRPLGSMPRLQVLYVYVCVCK